MTLAPTQSGVDTQRIEALVERKGVSCVSVCIPARDEERTVGQVVEHVVRLRSFGLVDEILVIDDGSTDATALEALAAGATVVTNTGTGGKGGALAGALEAATGEIVVFLDADVTTYSPNAIASLVEPLLTRDHIQLVKATYRRPLHGRADEGGRVTELVARPLLERFHPELVDVGQPLAGETAIRRRALDTITIADGYGIEIALLIDVFLTHGRGAITEVDLGVRTHRNRPLHELTTHAQHVIDAVLNRITPKESDQ